MTSINAENLAREILGTIGKGKKPSVRAIAPRFGYTPKTANSGQIQKTQSYKRVIEPVVTMWMKERERLSKEMMSRDLTKLQYRDAVDALDKLTKNIQLLSGGATENLAIKPLATLDELRNHNSGNKDSQSL